MCVSVRLYGCVSQLHSSTHLSDVAQTLQRIPK